MGLIPQSYPQFTVGGSMTPSQVKYDASGKPINPGYQTFEAPYSDPRAMDKFRDEALRKGPSAWSTMQNRSIDANTMNAKNQIAAGSQGSAATARGQLATHGGLTGGARERIARGSTQSALSMTQDANNQGNMNKMQTGINDEQNRIQQLGMVPAMQNTQNQFDMQAGMANTQGYNTFNQNNYSDAMAAWGADRTANAQAGLVPDGSKKQSKHG